MPLSKPINALVTPTPINAHEALNLGQPISPTHVSYSFSPLSGKFWHDIVEETENDDAGNWESNLDAKFASTLPSISEQCIQLEQDPASSLLAAIPLDSTSPYSNRSPTPSVHASPSMSRTPSKSKPSKSHSSISPSPSPRSSSSSSYAPPISKAKQRKLKQKQKRANKVINKPAEIQQGIENSTYWLDEVVKTNQAERAKAELEKASENLSGTPPSQWMLCIGMLEA